MKLQNMTTHSNIPGVLLGQMARHKKYRRMGTGKYMLDWVIDHAIKQSSLALVRLCANALAPANHPSEYSIAFLLKCKPGAPNGPENTSFHPS